MPNDKKLLEIEVCKHGRFNNKKLIGKVVVNILKLGVDVETTEYYNILNEGVKMGQLQLTFKRVSKEEKPIVKTVVLEEDIYQKNKIIHRKKYLPQEPAPKVGQLIPSTGLFSAVFTMSIMDIIQDIDTYIKEEGPIDDIEEVGFTGKVTNCYPPNIDGKVVPTNIWNFCFGDGMKVRGDDNLVEVTPFVMTDASAVCTYACFLTAYYPLEEEKQKIIKEKVISCPDQIYIPYTIGVTSKYPLLSLMRNWLKTIYEADLENKKKFTDYCHEVIFGTGLPSPGVTFDYDFKELGLAITINLPSCNSLTPLPTSIIPLIEMIGIEGIVSVWLSLLEGEKIILTSSSKTAMVYAIENFKSLLYPFVWCNICIDCLPFSLIEYLTSPMTYFMGVSSDYKEDIERVIKNEELVICELDKGIIKSKTKEKKVPIIIGDMIKELNEYYYERFNKTESMMSDVFEEHYYSQKCEEFNQAFKLIFFKYINILMSNYREYMGYCWISDNPVVVFSNDRFIYNQPEDRRDFLSALFESQHFQYFIQQFPKRQHHVFEDWQMNNYYLLPTDEIIKFYDNEYKPIIKFTKVTDKTLNKSKINTLVVDIGKLNSMRVVKEIVRTKIEPNYYRNHLSKVKKQDENAFNNDCIVECDKYISILVHINNSDNKSELETDDLYDFLSTISGRYIFFQRLMGNLSNFKHTIKTGYVTDIVFKILIEIFSQASSYQVSQNDLLTPVSMFECAKQLRYDNVSRDVRLVERLQGLDVWNKVDVWINIFESLLSTSKKIIFGDDYSLDLPFRWEKMYDDFQHSTFKSLECQNLLKIVVDVLNDMALLKCQKKTIKQFVGCGLSKFRIDKEIESKIDEVVTGILEKAPGIDVIVDIPNFTTTKSLLLSQIYQK